MACGAYWPALVAGSDHDGQIARRVDGEFVMALVTFAPPPPLQLVAQGGNVPPHMFW